MQIPDGSNIPETSPRARLPDGWLQEMLLGAQHLVVGQIGKQGEFHLPGFHEIIDQVVGGRSSLVPMERAIIYKKQA